MSKIPDEKALKQRAEKDGIFEDARIIAQAYGEHDHSATNADTLSIVSVFNDAADRKNPITVRNEFTQRYDDEHYYDNDHSDQPGNSVVITENGKEVFRANGPRAEDIQTYVPGLWEIDLYFMKQDIWLLQPLADNHLADAFTAARKKQYAEQVKSAETRAAEKAKELKKKGPPKGPTA